MMDVNSMLTGRRGVCLPFTDYCDPLMDAKQAISLPETFLDLSKQMGWSYMEFRGSERFFENAPSCEFFYGHILDLSPGADDLFKSLRDSTRRNIRKAQKEGIKIIVSDTADALHEFYRLNQMTRRDHGLPPQPYSFFKHLQECVLSKGLGFIILAYHKDQVIAANMYFRFGARLIYKYGASDKDFQHLRANNLVMWEAVKWGCDTGCKTLCFGRTEPENEGLRQFKAGWGAQEYVIRYYRYNLDQEEFSAEHKPINPLFKKIFGIAPVPVLRGIGKLLYRHMG